MSMDSERRIFMDGALAVSGQNITAIGTSAEISERYEATETIDGSRFVITPGLINAHVHITGDPLTRAWLPDNIDADFAEELTQWVLPRYYEHSPDDEEVSAELAALKNFARGQPVSWKPVPFNTSTVSSPESVVPGFVAGSVPGSKVRISAKLQTRKNRSPKQ